LSTANASPSPGISAHALGRDTSRSPIVEAIIELGSRVSVAATK
jgi:hypothetical protein